MDTRTYKRTGFSLIEVMLAIAVTAITVVGTINFRFLATRQAVQAEAYNTGARAGQVVLESWRALGAIASFDPLASLGSDSIDFSITSAKTGPSATTGLSEIGHYHIQNRWL